MFRAGTGAASSIVWRLALGETNALG